MIIRGNTVGTTTPKTNWNQTDPTKADYLVGREDLALSIQNAQQAADDATLNAGKANTAASNAQTSADNAQATAESAASAAGTANDAAGNAQTAANNAQTTANEAHTAIDNHKEDKNNPHEVTCAQIGATSMTLLWENASPTSDFAAQTIALDLSGYDGVKIVRTEKANTEANRGANGTFHMIVDAQVSYINYEGNIQVIFLQRDYTPSDTGIIFKDCKQCGYYAGSWGKGELRNDLMKPLKIYGIKGVIE